MQKRKLTKRERKCLRAASIIAKYSMEHGADIEATDRTYRGSPAIFDEIGNKVKLGIPYVRTS